MNCGKVIVLSVSLYFSFINLERKNHPGVPIIHFVMLIMQLPSFGLENIYKDLGHLFSFRPGACSGLEIGCFMVPLVMLSQMVFGKKNMFILQDNWSCYHNLTIQMALCTIFMLLTFKGFKKFAITTLGMIPLICYAIATTGNSYWKEDTNEIYMQVLCLLLYFIIFLVIMKLLPYSFTLGEVMVLSQTLAILFFDYSLSIYCRLRFLFPSFSLSSPTVVDDLPFTRTEITFILQTLIIGTLLTGLLLLPVFYYLKFVSTSFPVFAWSPTYSKLSKTPSKESGNGVLQLCDLIELWIGSLSFYAIWILSFIAIFLPSFYMTLGGTNPVIWMYYFFYRRPTRVYLVVFWFVIVLIALSTVAWKTHCDEKSKDDIRLPNIITRKIFHILAVIIFVSGIIYDPSLLHICSSVAATLFLVLEFIRFGRIKPFGDILHRYLSPFVDHRDSGPLIFTHLYLLIGCSLPLWLYPLDYHKLTDSGHEILLYSGVLSIGLGDAAASVIGVKFGSHYWKGTKKTLEGTTGSILIQFSALVPLAMWGMHLNLWSVGLAIVLSSLLEAFTTQIDNFVLPPFTYAILAMTCSK